MEGQQVDTAAVTDLVFDHIVTMNNIKLFITFITAMIIAHLISNPQFNI